MQNKNKYFINFFITYLFKYFSIVDNSNINNNIGFF